MEPIQGGGGAADLLHTQAGLWSHIFNHIGSMSLKCAVDLGIPDIIHRRGQPITLPELSAALSIPPAKSSHLRRVMRVLTHSGIFALVKNSSSGGGECAYGLTPLSRLLLSESGTGQLSPFVLAMLDPVVVTPFQFMGAWLAAGDDDAPSSPFAMAHNCCSFWDLGSKNPVFNHTFNAGMASDALFSADLLVKECRAVFAGLRSLVDVGGGTGSAARVVAKAFPHVKCSVLDLPQVVNTVAQPDVDHVDFIAGDMFEHVPPVDAVLLKCILHDWGDEDCVKILRRCRDAIPSREEGGKVIIVDLVVGLSDDSQNPKLKETQLHWDMLMLVSCGGAEREEHEWRELFVDAGFTDYKITPALGLRSVIEVYP